MKDEDSNFQKEKKKNQKIFFLNQKYQIEYNFKLTENSIITQSIKKKIQNKSTYDRELHI
jgi:hypothetical protein